MPRTDFVQALFHRLTLRYGRAFLARWEDVSVDEVKADWKRELANYAERPQAIEYALALMDPAEPPTAARFRELCASAPAPAFQAAPEPKEPQRAAEIRRKYLRPVAPIAGRERAWAARMVQRADAGERVSGYSLRMALDALKRPGSQF
ncbi:hypothetical protein [uncultured Azohydromonas sp.]|jgi:hypothetical protein|uniref:hypothetical protein n=1 Tax=uncultured Azohydromonas sp. TaxID=487342 RepID=UPI0026134598|nr:hypothetical protein [uncultured Azohydromonas sp.]